MGSSLKVAFVIKAVANEGGGAERVLALVASGLAERGHEVTIVSCDPRGAEPYYPLNSRVRLLPLSIGDTRAASSSTEFVRRVASYRRAILSLKPDVAVGFMHSSYVPLSLGLAGTGVPVVASEHIGPEHYEARLAERALLGLTVPLIAATTVVTAQIKASYGWWLRRKMHVVVNPVAFTRALGTPPDVETSRLLLSVGRLTPQKDHAVLIEAFARIASEFSEWRLRIIGEGELRSSLEALVQKHRLEGRVELPGAIVEVAPEYERAAVFVMPSRYESFGLATAEALAAGLPVVGFSDCPGTNLLVEHDVNGVLVSGRDRVHALGVGLAELMADAERRHRYSRAPRDWIERSFGVERVLDRWEELLNEVAGAVRGRQSPPAR